MKYLIRGVMITLLLLVASVAQSQTVVSWDHDPETLSRVQTYTFTLGVDATTPSATLPVCKQATVTKVTCESPLPVMAPGPHTLTVTATLNGQSASGSTTTGGPLPPINIRIIIKIIQPPE